MFVEGVDVNSVSEVYQEPSSVQKFLNGSSTDKHEYQAQVDTNSLDLSNCQRKKKKRAIKKRESSGCLGSNDEGALSSVMGAGEISQEAFGGPNSELFSGKKKKKSKRKKKRELTACLMTSLGSTVEGASPSVLVVPHSSVGEISLEQSDEILASCDVVKPMEEVVAGNSTSVLTGVEISLEKCPNGESEFGKMKEKSKMGNLEDSKAGSGRIHQRRKKKSSASHISSLESIEEGVQESSAPYICLNQLNEAPESSYSHKNMDVMVAGIVSQRKASSGCSNGEPACRNERKKSMMKKLENSNRGNSIVLNVSLVDIPETDFEQDISVRDISSNHVVKAEDDSSIPATRETSQEKASGGPTSELLSGQKKKESKRKKKQKFSDCPVTSLGSIEEGAPPSVLVIPDSSGGKIFLKQSDAMPAPCDLVKLREEVVAGNDTSLLDGRKISQEIASSDCPNGKSEFGKMEESEMGNLEENNAGHGRIHRRKKRKSVACPISNLESIEESLRESSAGDKCLNHMEEAPEPGYKEKMMEEVVTGLGISQRRVSCECPVGEPASGKKRKKFMLGIFEESDKGNSAVMDVFMVDTHKNGFEQFNKDKLEVQNTVLSKEDRASDDALGSVPSIDNIVVDKLNIQPVLKDKIPSSSKLGAMIESPQQSQGGAHLGNSRKKLLILDLNGLLVDIVPSGPGGYNQHRILSQKAVFKRPFCDDFLQFCFDRFHVGIWSSRARKNVKSVVDYLMGKSKSNLLLCWDQSHCTKTGYKTVENREKPLLLKELKKIWEKHEPDLPWATGEYNESNTLLLDDSPYKALRNPPYTAIFPHSYSYKDKRDNSLGPGGDLRVYLEGLALAEHVQKYVEQNPFGQRPITNTNLSWGFYRKIIGISSSKKGENATNDPSACQ